MYPFDEEGPDVSVHDAVLAAIPAVLVVVAAVGVALSLSVGTALGVGSLPATGAVGYALFYNPPEVERSADADE